MSTVKTFLRAISAAGMLVIGVAAAQAPAAAQVPEEFSQEELQNRIRIYDQILGIATARQADLAVREACLTQRTAALQSQNDRLEARVGALVGQLQALASQIQAHTAAVTEFRKQVQEEEPKIGPLVAEEAAWNERNQPYLRWRQACSDALNGNWGASMVCRAGATYPGNRSFEEPLTAARRRLQIAQDSLAAAQRNLAASEAALQTSQQEAAAARAELDQVQPALAQGKADLSAASEISFQAGGLLNEFGMRLAAARNVNREDERPQTIRLLRTYAARTVDTDARARELIDRMDGTYGGGWATPCR